LSLEERVRRKLILAGILPKLSDLGQGAIGEAIEAALAGQFGRLHKEALDDGSILDDIRNANCPYYLSEAAFLSLTARDASTKPNIFPKCVRTHEERTSLLPCDLEKMEAGW
jgi:hypothetical protein